MCGWVCKIFQGPWGTWSYLYVTFLNIQLRFLGCSEYTTNWIWDIRRQKTKQKQQQQQKRMHLSRRKTVLILYFYILYRPAPPPSGHVLALQLNLTKKKVLKKLNLALCKATFCQQELVFSCHFKENKFMFRY